MAKRPPPPPPGEEDFQMTKAELKKLVKAMDEPQFRDLLSEYVDEISDPKNRKEHEQYLEQMEAQNDLPPNTKLVRPVGAFCIKTTTRRILKNQKKNLKYYDQKTFINICGSDHIQPGSKEAVVQNGVPGYSWQLPYTLSKGRPDRDRKDAVCMTYDIIFNTETVAIAHKTPNLKQLMCDTAIEALNTYLKESQETASMDYRLMKNVTCKGGMPAYITMKFDKKSKSKLAKNLKAKDHKPKLMKEIEKQKEENPIQEDACNEKKRRDKKKRKNKNSKPYDPDSTTPNYRLKYSYDVELTNCFEGPGFKKEAEVPREIIITIDLPGIKSLKDAQLDISQKKLIFKYEDRYNLDINLLYPVIDTNGKAKFDKSKHQLLINLPINKELVKQAEVKQIPPNIEELSEEKQLEENSASREMKEELSQITSNKEEGEESVTQELFNIHSKIKSEEVTFGESLQDRSLEIKYKESENIVQEEHHPIIEEKKDELPKKPLIEEIHEPPEKIVEKNLEEKHIKIFSEADLLNFESVEATFQFRESADGFIFLLYNIKNYQKENVLYVLTPNEIFLVIYDPAIEKTVKTAYTLFAECTLSESKIEMFKDFVTIKIKKAVQNPWDSLGYPIADIVAPQRSEFILTNMKKYYIEPTISEQDEEKKKENEKQDLVNEEQEKIRKAEEEIERRQRSQTMFVKFKNSTIFQIF